LADGTDNTVRQIQEAGAAIGGFAGALLDTNPSLTRFSANITGVNKVMGYLQSNLNNLRNFASMGADFGMDINLMTTSVTGARSSFAALNTMLKNNASSLALYSGTIGEGLETFLGMQRAFYFDQNGAATEASLGLQRLGLTTEQINEQFLLYDRLQRYGRRGEQFNIAQRNAAAAAFAKELTTLARLTGVQADELTANLNKIQREGDVAAFTMGADPKMGTAFTLAAGEADSYSKQYGALVRDIFLRAAPSEDTAMLNNMLPQTSAKLFEAYQAQINNDVTGAQRALAEAQNLYFQEMQSETVRSLANWKGYTNETTQVASAVSEYVTGAGRAVGDALLRERDRLGRDLSDAEAMIIRDRVKATLAGQERPPAPGDPRAATDAIIRAEGEIASMALALQTQMRDVYATLGESANQFLELIRGAGVKVIDGTVEMFNGAIAAIGLTGATSVEERNRIAGAAILRLNEAARPEDATELAAIQGRLNELDSQTGPMSPAEQVERERLLSEMRRLVSASPTLANVEIIRANQLIIDGQEINPNLVRPERPFQGSDGTIGAVGNIIRDFGKETNAQLHGREAVLNEKQLTNLALGLFNYGSMSASEMSRDTLNAVTNGYISPETITNTITASLGGMLNTVRNNQNRQMPSQLQEIDFTGLETEIGRLASQMKQPFEEALNNTLRMPLEQLAVAANEGNELQRRSVKGIQGMGNDYLRGA
jgi:hypothetical protein